MNQASEMVQPVQVLVATSDGLSLIPPRIDMAGGERSLSTREAEE